MSAYEVTGEVVRAILEKKFDLIILNYANADMVGHTGVLGAAIKAIEAVDSSLGRVIDALKEVGGKALVVSDHGNAEQMLDYETREPYTAHTSNLVPCILYDQDAQGVGLRDGILADVGPTILELLGVGKPPEMTAGSLIVRDMGKERGV
jgi:2,3-bisphosphoglycerate-independent phosphoglycerate mutase